MIKIHRTAKPSILEKKADAWRNKLLAATSGQEQSKIQNNYRHNQVKRTLVEMFNGKCAYCESKITHIDYGHIEHFKPKSRFKELSFEWSNLLLACGICNGSEHKGDKFPDETEGGPLVDPCVDDPSEHLIFNYDPSSKLATVIGKTERGNTSQRLLGLNRNELRTYRSRQISKLFVLHRLAQVDLEAAALFQEAQSDCSEYSAFAKALAKSPT